MDITFSEIDNLDDSFGDINQNPYFNESSILKKNQSQSQKIKPILKNKNISEPENFQTNNYSIENNIKTNKNNIPVQLQRRKKKGVSYDDILSSMNTVVIDGKLEFIRNDNEIQRIQREINESNGQQITKKIVNLNHEQTPIDPNVKNSYIFNKYFKDYKDPNAIEKPVIPLTKKQLLKKLIIEKVNHYNDQIRLSQVKSTKLLFNSNNNNIIRSSPIFNQDGTNHLFKFK
jgi:hypothetical protein